jgi:hypothetical protein
MGAQATKLPGTYAFGNKFNAGSVACRLRLRPHRHLAKLQAVGARQWKSQKLWSTLSDSGAIRYEVRCSRMDAHPCRILGGDTDLCSRRWAGWGTRWIRRPWRRTWWSLVEGIFCGTLLRSFDWALFRTHLRTSRPQSQSGGAKRSSTGAPGSYSVTGIRPAGIRSSAEGSVYVPATHRTGPPT